MIPFVTQSSPADYAGGRLLNYAFQPTQGPQQGATLGRSGLTTHAALTGDPERPVRAVTTRGTDIYAACGGRLWKVSGGTATDLGSIPDDIDTQMDASASRVCLTAGGSYFTSDGKTVTGHATGQVSTARGVAVMDGYAIVVGSDATRGDRIAVSRVDDQTTFDGLDFATAEASPDDAVGIIRDHGELRVFGARTAEAFYNSGGTFPFTRQPGALMERGCIRASTIAKADNAIYWIGDDFKAYRSFGSSPEIVSTGEISEYFAGVTILGGFAFEDRGRKFYAVRVQDGPTWVYCIAIGLWSEFSTGADHGPWTATCAVEVGGVWYFGTSNGTIATAGGWTDEGAVIRAEAWAMPIAAPWTQLNRIEVQMDTGNGSGDRTLNMQLSRDGKVWGTTKPRALGGLGNYRQMARWSGMGRYEHFVQMRFWITDAVQRDIYGGRVA